MSDTSDDRWLVVGLGNPGSRYRHTRHNIGFRVVEACSVLAGPELRWKASPRFKGTLALGTISQRSVVLLEPQTCMNLSGEAVEPVAHFYRIAPDHIVAIHDDVDLATGRLKLKQGGGDGGHKGLRSMTELLGSADFLRLRFGVGRPPRPEIDVADFVLSDFADDEREVVSDGVERAVQALRTMLTRGLKEAMNRFNQPPRPQRSPADEAAPGPHLASRGWRGPAVAVAAPGPAATPDEVAEREPEKPLEKPL